MKNCFVAILIAFLALLGSPASTRAAVVMEVYLHSAPNAFGSPSWEIYAEHTLAALEFGLPVVGLRSVTPTGYARLNGSFEAGDVMVTSFPSWRGSANPAPPFSGEFGNRLHAALRIVGTDGETFRLDDLTFELHSGDPGDSLLFEGDFIGLGYNMITRYGIDYGEDGMRGGVDDIFYNSGNGTTPVNEILYAGVGNAFWPDGLPSLQMSLDDTAAWINSNVPWVKASYCIKDQSGLKTCASDRATIAASVPEPGTILLLGAGLIGLGIMRRRVV